MWRSATIVVLLTLLLATAHSQNNGFRRQPYRHQFLEITFIVCCVIIFIGLLLFLIFFGIWKVMYGENAEEKGVGCCESCTWGTFHVGIFLMVAGVTGVVWTPTLFNYIDVAGAIVLSLFWAWPCWVLLSPPSVTNLLATGKRNQYFSMRRKLLPFSWEFCLFYTGLALIFLACFLVPWYLEDICIDFFPLTFTSRRTREGKTAKCEGGGGKKPCHVYLTAPERVDTMMIVNFHTFHEFSKPIVLFDTTSRANESLSAYQFNVVPTQRRLDAIKERERWISWADLIDLQPNTVYYFVVGDMEAGADTFTTERSFRTANSSGPVSFAVGGDHGLTDEGFTVLGNVAKRSPAFISVCGDITYDQGFPYCYLRLDSYLYNWDQRVRTPDDHVIPMLTCAGNHEGGWDIVNPREDAAFLQPYFAHRTGLGSLDLYDRSTTHVHFVSDTAKVIVLDSGHFKRAADEVDFLRVELQQAKDAHLLGLVMYHIPIYRADPAGRNDDNTLEMKHYWGPVFDEYDVAIVFEQHDHSFKRTFPLKGGVVDQNGTVYLGDGAIGVDPVDGAPWPEYFEKQANGVRHMALVEVNGNVVTATTITQADTIFDQFNVTRNL